MIKNRKDEFAPEWTKRIAARRKELGLSMTQCAAAAGMSKQAWSWMEAGKSWQLDSTKLAVAEVLGLNVNELFKFPEKTEIPVQDGDLSR